MTEQEKLLIVLKVVLVWLIICIVAVSISYNQGHKAGIHEGIEFERNETIYHANKLYLECVVGSCTDEANLREGVYRIIERNKVEQQADTRFKEGG